jgi:hypothetical protein
LPEKLEKCTDQMLLKLPVLINGFNSLILKLTQILPEYIMPSSDISQLLNNNMMLEEKIYGNH